MPTQPTMASERCKAIKSNGKRCGAWPRRGATVCPQHGGMFPSVVKKARVVADLRNWGLDSPTVDPAEQLLRLVSQSAARVAHYSAEIAQMVTERPYLRLALTEAVWAQRETTDAEGETGYDTYKAGEYIRAMVILENEERDRCAKFCAVAINAGLREREVQVAERQGQMIAGVLRAVFGDARLGLTEDQRALSVQVIDEHVMAAIEAADTTAAPERVLQGRRRG